MKKIGFLLVFLCCITSMKAADENFYLFLCIGGDDMEERGHIDKQNLDNAQAVLYLNEDTPYNMQPSTRLWNTASALYGTYQDKTGFLNSFALTILKNLPPRGKVGIIRLYIKDFKVSQLASDYSFYSKVLELVNKARKDGTLKGVVLTPGKNDVVNEEWMNTVKAAYGMLLGALNMQPRDLPAIIGETANNNQNTFIDKAPQYITSAGVASAKGCEKTTDGSTFTMAGYDALGKRYAIKMMQMMGFDVVNQQTKVVTTTTNLKPAFDIQASLKGNIIFATASSAIAKVEIKDATGKVIKTIDAKAAKSIDVDLKGMPDGKLIVWFYGENGGDNSFTIE